MKIVLQISGGRGNGNTVAANAPFIGGGPTNFIDSTGSAAITYEVAEGLLIYPNSVSSLTITMYGAPVSQATISNVFGQVVETAPRSPIDKLTMIEEREMLLDISCQPPGIYFVKVNGMYVQKFIKQ